MDLPRPGELLHIYSYLVERGPHGEWGRPSHDIGGWFESVRLGPEAGPEGRPYFYRLTEERTLLPVPEGGPSVGRRAAVVLGWRFYWPAASRPQAVEGCIEFLEGDAPRVLATTPAGVLRAGRLLVGWSLERPTPEVHVYRVDEALAAAAIGELPPLFWGWEASLGPEDHATLTYARAAVQEARAYEARVQETLTPLSPASEGGEETEEGEENDE